MTDAQIFELKRSCLKCGEEKSLDQFWRDNRRFARVRELRSARCNACAKAIRSQYELLPNTDPRIANGVRRCATCGEEKSLTLFGRTRYAPLGRQYRCRPCFNATRRTGPREPALPQRDYTRKKYRGVGPEEFRALYDAQNGRCGICDTALDFLAKDTCLDHDHETNLVRGVLCGRCNLGIGHMRDRIDLLEAAIVYLRKFAPAEKRRA